jgi:uncharacterized protein
MNNRPDMRGVDTSAASDTLTSWVITPGSAGHEVQCIGVLEAMGLQPEIKRVAPPAPWRWMAPWGPAAPDRDIDAPWPDIVVASGRQAVPYARMIRRRSHGRTFVAFLLGPGVSPSGFDLVWVPQHDRVRGDNVIVTLTSPHRLTGERLVEEAACHAEDVAHLPRPRVCVLVGGNSAAYRFGSDEAERLALDLRDLTLRHGCGLLVTPSRRTGQAQIAKLKDRLADCPAVVWDLDGPNPYFGYIGLADAFVVTCDSANMLGEAAFTGKPLYAYRLPGGNAKFERFHSAMEDHGVMRWFDGSLAQWTYRPLDATTEIAAVLRERLAAHRLRQYGSSMSP